MCGVCMKCKECNNDAEIVKNDDGTYEYWCDCGYHDVIVEE